VFATAFNHSKVSDVAFATDAYGFWTLTPYSGVKKDNSTHDNVFIADGYAIFHLETILSITRLTIKTKTELDALTESSYYPTCKEYTFGIETYEVYVGLSSLDLSGNKSFFNHSNDVDVCYEISVYFAMLTIPITKDIYIDYSNPIINQTGVLYEDGTSLLDGSVTNNLSFYAMDGWLSYVRVINLERNTTPFFYEGGYPTNDGGFTTSQEHSGMSPDKYKISESFYYPIDFSSLRPYRKVKFDFDSTAFEDGHYLVQAIDYTGRWTEFKVTIDNTKPIIQTYVGDKHNKYINYGFGVYGRDSNLSLVYWTHSTSNLVECNVDNATGSAKYNVFFNAEDEDGWYSFIAVDEAGNRSEVYNINFDKTAPTLKSSTVTSGGHTNTQFTIAKDVETNWSTLYWTYSASDLVECNVDNATVSTTATSKVINANAGDGWYSFIAVDKAGNRSANYNVHLDTVKPTLSIFKYGGGEIVDGKNVNSILYFTASDVNKYSITFQKKTVAGTYENTSINWSAFLFATIYYDNREIDFAKGVYSRNTFYTRAAAESYVLEKEKSRVFEYQNWSSDVLGEIPTDEKALLLTGSPYFVYRNSSGVEFIFSTRARAYAYIESKISQYISQSQYNYFWEEGDFKLTLTDLAGNSYSKTFVIDFTTPTIRILRNGIEYIIETDKDIFFGIDDEIEIVPYDLHLDKLLLNDVDQGALRVYQANELIDAKTYTIKLSDKAGNETKLSFKIDLKAPVLAISQAFYKSTDKVTLSVTESNTYVVYLDGVETTRPSYVTASELFSEGAHTYVVVDAAGNTTAISFTTDYTAPIINTDKALYGLADILEITVSDLYLATFRVGTDTPENISSLNGAAMFSYAVVNLTEKTYTYTVTDKAGNSSTIDILIDKTAPEFSELKAYYNQGEKVDISINKTKDKNAALGFVVYLDSVSTTQEIYYTLEYGSHTLRAEDAAGNYIETSFFYGTTQPKVSLLKGSAEFSTTVYIKSGESVTLSVNEEQYNYTTLNQNILTLAPDPDVPNRYYYTWQADQESEGINVIHVYDNAQNISTISFVVDKTAPQLTVTIKNEAKQTGFYATSNQTVKLSTSDNLAFNYLKVADSEPVTGTTFSINTDDLEDGRQTIRVFDKAGNETAFIINVDKTAPEIKAEKNGITVLSNTAFLSYTDILSFAFVEVALFEVKLDASLKDNYKFNASDLSDGVHVLTATDKAGNTSNFSFCVDKTNPVISLKKNGTLVESGAYFVAGLSISINADDTNLDKMYFDSDLTSAVYRSSSELYEGEHTFIAIDKAGNKSTIKFVVDKTAPKIELNKTVDSDSIYYYKAREFVILTITEENSYTIKMNDETLTQEFFEVVEQADGEYAVVVTDIAGNKNTVKLRIDKTAPQLLVKIGTSGELMADGLYIPSSKNIHVEFTDTNKNYWTLDGDTKSVTTIYSSDLDDGLHTITGYDKAGNSAYATFTIDKTAPIIIANKVINADGKYYYNPKDAIRITVDDINLISVTQKKNDALESSTLESTDLLLPTFALSVEELEDNTYIITATDRAGNATSINIVIDKIAPTVLAKIGTNGKLSADGLYVSDSKYVYVELTDGNKDYWTLSGQAMTGNISSAGLEDGTYTIIGYDKAGNSASATFTIDKTAPVIALTNKVASDDAKYYYNASDKITFYFEELNFSNIQIDTTDLETLELAALDLADGTHSITVYDLAGNSAKVSFIVDTLAPTLTLRKSGYAVESATHFASGTSVDIVISEANKHIGYLNEVETTVNYWSASDLNEQEHIYVYFDRAGNSASVTFVVDKTKPTITPNKDINADGNYYYTSSESINLNIDDINLLTVTQKTNASTVALSEYILNSDDLADDIYTMIATDKAGNATTVKIVVDKIAPSVLVKVGTNGELKVVGHFVASAKYIYVEFTDTNKNYWTLDGDTKSVTTIYSSDLDDGLHTITGYDKAGNSASATFTIDKTAPILYFTDKTPSDDAKYYYNTKENVSYYADDANYSYTLCDTTSIDTFELLASSLSDGAHSIAVYDKAGNFSKISFVVDAIAPTLTLRKSGQVVDSASHFASGTSVDIVITETNKYKGFLNDAETNVYSWSASELSEQEHTYKYFDRAGNSASVTFVVDKTNPTITPNRVIAADGYYYYAASESINLNIDDLNLLTVTQKTSASTVALSEYILSSDDLADDIYTMTATDKAGNASLVKIVVDKTAPSVLVKIGTNGELKANGLYVPDLKYIYVEFTDTNKNYWTLDGEVKSTSISASELEDGLHTITGYDKAGNSAVATFTIDKTAPVLYLTNKAVADDSKYYYNASEKISFYVEDTNYSYVLCNTTNIDTLEIAASSLSDGTHSLTVYDKAGNYKKLSFNVDKTAPVVNLKKNAETVASTGVFFKADQIISIATNDESGVLLTTLDSEVTVFKSWNVSSLSDGNHVIKVFDRAENTTEVSFIVDNTFPTFEINAYYKAGETFDIVVLEENNYEVLLDNAPLLDFTLYADNMTESEHSICVIDQAGNTTLKKFIIDTTVPTLESYKNSFILTQESLQYLFLVTDDIFSIKVSDTNLLQVEFDGEPVTTRLWKANDLDEREHIIIARDMAGNLNEISFIVDKTAPAFDLQNYYTTSQYITIGVNEVNEYRVFLDNVELELAQSVISDTLAEAEHEIFVVDAAGNSTRKTFVVDLNAPIINLTGFARDGTASQLDNGISYGTVNIEFLDISTHGQIYYSKNDAPPAVLDHVYENGKYSFTIADDISNNGKWTIHAIDMNGYKTQEIILTLDFSLPVFSLDGINTSLGGIAYTNTSFTYSKDNAYAYITYSKNGKELITSYDSCVTIDVTAEGRYTFFVTDAFSRQSETSTIVLQSIIDFKNLTDIQNSYKTSTWYTVTLPYKIFGATTKANISGTYSFPDYQTALEFAIEKETIYRVIIVDGKPTYVSTSNETVYLTYDDTATLDSAIQYYAVKYISNRKTFSHIKDRNSYDTVTPVDLLTVNNPTLPEYLSEYASLQLLLASKTFKPSDNSQLSKSQVVLTYLGNLTSAITLDTIYLSYGQTLADALTSAGSLYEGYYLYVESDLCGNAQRAILLLDFSEPYLKVEVVRGTETEPITITRDSVSARNGIFYVVSLNINELLDSADNEFVGVYIASSGFSATFAKGDTIPAVNETLGSGKYSITVYDRSYNMLTFEVVVAGKLPTWFNSSPEANQESMLIYITKNDQYNAFISLKIVKIKSDGTYTYLSSDDEGVSIDVSTLKYTIKTGGKYACILEDVYGRIITFEPVFYKKGLPTGVLQGVRDGGTTLNTVTFSYADTFGLDIFTVTNTGVRLVYDGPLPEEILEQRSCIVTFTPTTDATVQYLLVLYQLADAGIYIEYSFTLDAEAPAYLITSVENTEIAAGSSINMPFLVNWGEETATVYVTKNNGSRTSYAKNTLISNNGLYVFTIADKTGNTALFSIYLDTEVVYSLSATFVEIGINAYITNKEQILTVNEDLKFFACVFNNETTYEIARLVNEGIYALTLEDLYGNVAEFTIELDFTAPLITLENAIDGLANGEVIVRVNDATATLEETTKSYKDTKKNLNDGAALSDEGVYYLKASDVAGNVFTVALTIDKHVDYTANIETGITWTNSTQITFNETVIQSVSLNGEPIDIASRYTEVGNYKIHATDNAKNEVIINFEILPARVQALNQAIPDGFTVSKLVKDTQQINLVDDVIALEETGKYTITLKHVATGKAYDYTITVDQELPTVNIVEKSGTISFSKLNKQDVTAVLYKDGTAVDGFTLSTKISDAGNYVLVLTDDVGNVASYDFNIPTTVDPFTIVLIVIGCAILSIITFLAIRGRRVKTA
jgi:hypothetical protein